ncbi:MAG: hypothetical protein OSA99_02380 [Acidimicrobiales bacterium]|nr:hypothetical protein [Acidimicrobiales bacterium]
MSDDEAPRGAATVARLLAGRGRLAGAAVAAAAGAAAAGAAVAAIAQRRRDDRLVLPDPAPLAAAAATSVHNAAKNTVIASVRESDDPDRALVLNVVRDAVTEATSAGADVLAAAIGAVEGASIVAHLIGEEPRDLVRSASTAVIDAAERQGRVASDRVSDVLWKARS